MSEESAPSNESALSERIGQVLREAHNNKTGDGGVYNEKVVREALINAGIDTTGMEINVDTHTGTDPVDPTGEDLHEYVVHVSLNGKQIFYDFYDFLE
ncbi:MAG: hypothetical protein CEO12_495 [Parcubacteria group bacterium Gr01-1014_46]|nr:MAG: hypothetical protein CEO12_495 [Parcubacteria group bacterium Gr01-1014_46]